MIFHRVIEDFMIQGATQAVPVWAARASTKSFEDEFSRELYNLKGALSMANAGPNTNGSQFFIVTASNGAKHHVRSNAGTGFP